MRFPSFSRRTTRVHIVRGRVALLLFGILVFLRGIQALLPTIAPSVVRDLSSQQRMAASTTLTADTVDNWRSISLTEDDIPSEWSIRPLWSESAFQRNLQTFHQLAESNDEYLQPYLQSALSSLNDALRLYQPDSLIISFNGGKDASLILYLTIAAMAQYYDQHPSLPRYRPRAVYFDHPDEFPAVRTYSRATSSIETADLDLWAFSAGTSFPAGLSALVQAHAPRPLAFVLGTRVGDPNAAGQTAFIPSSSSYMPPFMRVNPILDWEYGRVWYCLRKSSSSSTEHWWEYCSLYDEGYTSLGTTKDTLPCPALRTEDGSYLPAYMLQDWDQERAGRISKKGKGRPEISNATTTGQSNSVTTASAGCCGNAVERSPSPSTALLIIGDEILKGYCNDTNTGVAARALNQQNLTLDQVSIVSDTLDAIVEAIHRLSPVYDVLITSGGVGPTHDDVTLKAIAQALESPLVRNEALATLVADRLPQATPAVATKMATVPACAELRYLPEHANNNNKEASSKKDWPILQCHNIFVLPGVPQFFAEKVSKIAEHLAHQETTRRTTTVPRRLKVVLGVDEVAIVDVLDHVVEAYPCVTFGSYPMVDSGAVKTVLTVESTDHVAVPSALGVLQERLPEGSILRVDVNNMTLVSE